MQYLNPEFNHCVKIDYFYLICSVGEPVELSSRFIRYSTFKTGKEQLVSTHTHTQYYSIASTKCTFKLHLSCITQPLCPPPPPPPPIQVNCGTLESLLERLVKVSHYGLDFLNTFLMTFPLYTTAHHVLDFLSKSYHNCLGTRERKRSGSVSPQDAVRDARGKVVLWPWRKLGVDNEC